MPEKTRGPNWWTVLRAHRWTIFLWTLAAAVVVGAAVASIVDDEGEPVPPLLVALALVVIATATPGARDLVNRLTELSAGGVSLKLGASPEAVEQRLDLRSVGLQEATEPEDEQVGGFVEAPSEESAVHDILELRGHLDERLSWINEQLGVPGAGAHDNLSRIDGLVWQRLLLPDEANLLKLLASISPKQAVKEHERDPAALLALVRSSNKLLGRMRRIVFDRRVRQVFQRREYANIWRVFDWEPQPRGRPWFIAHVDEAHSDVGERARTVIVAPRVAPTDKGLERALQLLRDHRNEMWCGTDLVGIVVLRDSSRRLEQGRQLSDERARTMSLSELEAYALSRRLP